MQDEIVVPRFSLFRSEDWWAVWLGGAILAVAFAAVYAAQPPDAATKLDTLAHEEDHARELRAALETAPEEEAANLREQLAESKARSDALRAEIAPNPLARSIAKVGAWESNPLDAFWKKSADGSPKSLLPGILVVFAVSLALFGLGTRAMGRSFSEFAPGFAFVFVLATLGFVLANQKVINHLSLEYPLWGLLVGLIISNTVGTPAFVKPAVQTEFYVKTGLVLLGATVLFNRLLMLGVPGICVSWVGTPLVLVTTYVFGQRVLRMQSRTLNMVISADMSVCGVSAAIATAAACRAKKEELSLAIGLSLAFTVVMMVVMPGAIRAFGMSDVLGGAWMGGTIDATGAVAAAGAALGESAMTVAVTIKMIQNILIGAVAFAVAVYWVAYVEPSENRIKPSPWEIWRRFPRFVIGFVLASLVFSYFSGAIRGGDLLVDSTIKGTTDVFRGWFFALAFVSIGLETNFRDLAQYLEAGKPLVLYVCGQTLNLCVTLFMAWLMFEVVFRDAVKDLLQ